MKKKVSFFPENSNIKSNENLLIEVNGFLKQISQI